MKNTKNHKIASLFIGTMLALHSVRTPADDIDIFVGGSGGAAAAPVVMMLLDSTNDWCTDQPNAKSKIAALKKVMTALGDPAASPVNVGLAMWSYNSPSGAYIRFGPRNMKDDFNRNAFANMLDTIALCPGAPDNRSAKVPLDTGNAKDESAGLFEMWRYYKGLQAKTGLPTQNDMADFAANSNYTTIYPSFTGFGALTTAKAPAPIGFPFLADNKTYKGEPFDCSKFYVIYVAANNGSPNDGAGSQTYTGAGTDAGTTYNAGAAVPKAKVGGVVPKTGWADAWARFLNNPATSADPKITSYVIDAYFPVDNQDVGYSLFLQSVARQGGGTYFAAKDNAGADIYNALMRIFAEIKSVNSTFASASLPVNATNRAQNENQVFIGMFRPDPDAKPRWFGNMKRYQLIDNAGNIDLADANGLVAVNSLTGFLTDCAASFWTTDSTTYWQTITTNPSSKGNCATTAYSPYSDSPDGPFVEKGGVAEIIRKGNNPPSTDTSPTNGVLRSTYTLSTANAVVAFSASNTSLGSSLVNFTLGQDVNAEVTTRTAPSTSTRPSLHGDVIHSRPLPLNYGGAIGTVVYYGANDGNLRAVDAATGKERWTFLTREHYPKLQRMMDQDPLVFYPNQLTTSGTAIITVASPGVVTWTGHTLVNGATVRFTTTGALPGGLAINTRYFVVNAVAATTFQVSATSGGAAINTSGTQSGTHTAFTPGNVTKDYFFDGSIGAFQNLDNTKVWIYPSMRRGGRQVYALDVSLSAGAYPTQPSFMWKAGCPNLADDTGCTLGLTEMGQTWSLPAVAFVKGYSSSPGKPTIMFGGGYDPCEDANSTTPTCSTAKGRRVFVVDAEKGAGSGAYNAATNNLLQTFNTDRSVVADIALIDIDNDNNVDYAYVVDTGGNIYRIAFVDSSKAALTPDKWTITKIAYTTGAGRKFLFAPALLYNNNKVYVAVGSGDREHPLQSQYPYGDGKTTNVINRFYVFLDDLTTTTATNLDDTSVMLDKTTDLGCNATNELLIPASTKKGWFMSLNANGPGEQVVTSAVIAAGLVTFSTNRPVPAPAGSCTTQLGEARGYFLNVLNGSGAIGVTGSCGGTRSGTFAGGGLPPSPVVGTIPVGGVMRTVVIGAIQRTGAGSSPIGSQQLKPPITQTRRRIYWYTPGTDN
jgi:Tfp pilus tip-associated adhesin PilY1